jgi:hypothetical protein
LDDVGRQTIAIVNTEYAPDDSCKAEDAEIVPRKESSPSMGKEDIDNDRSKQEVYREVGWENPVHFGSYS